MDQPKRVALRPVGVANETAHAVATLPVLEFVIGLSPGQIGFGRHGMGEHCD